MNKLKLTQIAKTAGWAAKIGPDTLAQVLSKLPHFSDPNLIVGIETSDDAAIYKITDEIAMIQTVDFFTPIVDDPYMFGQIAAANALSDVYAMGGEPKVALNIVGFPNCLDVEILGQILLGGADKVKEAGAVLVGGHSVQDDEPKYGLCVSGFVHPDKVFKNYGAKPGDVLILTKQIGNGIINTALKAGLASDEEVEEAQKVMASLNKKAKEVITKYNDSACTDITWFGFICHSVEMAEASGVSFEINVKNVPYFSGAINYATMGLLPAGGYRNRNHTGEFVDGSSVEEVYVDLLYDPQTSGGLLISVSEEEAHKMMEDFNSIDMESSVAIVGKVTEEQEKRIILI